MEIGVKLLVRHLFIELGQAEIEAYVDFLDVLHRIDRLKILFDKNMHPTLAAGFARRVVFLRCVDRQRQHGVFAVVDEFFSARLIGITVALDFFLRFHQVMFAFPLRHLPCGRGVRGLVVIENPINVSPVRARVHAHQIETLRKIAVA